MFKALCFALANGYVYQAPNYTGMGPTHATLEDAKAAAASFVTNSGNERTFAEGYDVLIIDMNKGEVVSRSTTVTPSLTWNDTPQVVA